MAVGILVFHFIPDLNGDIWIFCSHFKLHADCYLAGIPSNILVDIFIYFDVHSISTSSSPIPPHSKFFLFPLLSFQYLIKPSFMRYFISMIKKRKIFQLFCIGRAKLCFNGGCLFASVCNLRTLVVVYQLVQMFSCLQIKQNHCW